MQPVWSGLSYPAPGRDLIPAFATSSELRFGQWPFLDKPRILEPAFGFGGADYDCVHAGNAESKSQSQGDGLLEGEMPDEIVAERV